METWFWILGWFLSILTIAGNGFIIFLVCSKRQLRTKTNAFVVSLAVADFCVGMSVVPPLFLYKMTSDRPLQPKFPEGKEFVRWLFIDASVTNLCSLVLDRYIAVVRPLKYLTFMTRRRVIQMISLSWAITILFILLESSLWFTLKAPRVFAIFIWLVIIFFELLPCLMLVVCFASMLRVVYKHDRASRTLSKQLRFNHRVLFKSHEKSAIMMMAIVVGLFLVCHGIYLRCGLIIVLNDETCNHSHYTIPILVLNSAANPLAYAFFKRDIKKEFKRLIYTVITRKGNKVKPLNEDNHDVALGSYL